MNHLRFDMHIVNDGANMKTAGPTLAIAIGQALPDFSWNLVSTRTFLGARPCPDGSRSYHGYGLVIDVERDMPQSTINRYGTRQPIPAFSDPFDLDIEVFDTYEEMLSCERSLRYAAQDLIVQEKYHPLIRSRSLEYQQALSNVLVWNPAAKVDILANLAEIFDGRDWTPFFPASNLEHCVVQVQNLAIVERAGSTLLIRFDYMDGNKSGRELEFADLTDGRLEIRQSRYSALRSFDPPFNGWQLPQVYSSLQQLLDAGRYVDVCDERASVSRAH